MSAFPYLKTNIDFLQSIGHPMYMWLSAQDYDGEAMARKLIKNKFGILDWRMENGEGLFDKIPPAAVYTKWVPENKADTSASIVVGCNLGYGLNHLLMHTPDSHKVILLEPNAEMLLACMGQTDYTPFFQNGKLHLCPPDEGVLMEMIKKMDLQYIYGNIHLRCDIPSAQMSPAYAEWGTRVRHKLENFTLELATLRCRQDVMVSNELNNYQRAMQDGSLRTLQNTGEGVAAVILGAGPSLAEMAPRLKEQNTNCLMTTALQTLPSLRKHDLKPHFCLAIDYDHSMLSIYDRLDPEWCKDIPLIYSTKLNPEVVRRYPGPTIPLWTVGGMATFVLNQHDLVLDAGGNVSLTLARFLSWCGISHAVLVGQDFAWKGAHTHADGHHYSHNVVTYDPKRHQKLTNLYGEEILSTVQYLSAKRDLEDDLAKSEIRFFNLYGGGAPITGAENIEMQDALMKGIFASAPGSVDTFMARLMNCRNDRHSLQVPPRSHEWTTSLRHVDRRLGKLFKRVSKNQQEIHDLLTQVEIFIKQDPVYITYLYNETIDLAGLTRAKAAYEAKDLSQYRKIIKNVLRKVREMDRVMAGEAAEAA